MEMEEMCSFTPIGNGTDPGSFVQDRSKVVYQFTQQNFPACKPVLSPQWIHKHMKAPIFIYYQLDNYYQNHRRTDELKVNRRKIAWKSDREHKFGKEVYPFNFQNGSLIGGANLDTNIPLSDQEGLIVWMRTAALPTFRKLYGKIEEDLEADDIILFQLLNNYNTYSFGGSKTLVLSTSSWLGGRNNFLGMAYITIGICFIFVAVVFLLLHVKFPRPYGDTIIYPGIGARYLVEGMRQRKG